MSILYASSNKEGSRDLFEKRTIYINRILESDYTNLIDFNFGEKLLYGRVDRDFVPMIVKPVKGNLKNFKRVAKPAEAPQALNFVVDAFEQMARQFEKCAMLGKIDNSDRFLTNLKVYKGYQDQNVLYRNHLITYSRSLNVIFKRNGIKIRNFDEFMKELMVILSSTASRNAFTRPGYLKSKRCPINCSGLAVEIADLDASNDEEKMKQFVNSRNWDFYLQTCSSYGFMVDANVPWRMVADIGSYPIKSAIFDFATNYGLDETTDIMVSSYMNAYAGYFISFPGRLLTLYNSLKKKSFLEQVYEDGMTCSKKVVPAKYTLQTLREQYTPEHFMRWYFDMRFMEEESQFTDQQKLMIIDDSIELFKVSGEFEAIRVFETILNKTLDYVGSLSYINKSFRALLAEESE